LFEEMGEGKWRGGGVDLKESFGEAVAVLERAGESGGTGRHAREKRMDIEDDADRWGPPIAEGGRKEKKRKEKRGARERSAGLAAGLFAPGWPS
jgi:hypothetical protein